ncbi:hypothetical protein PGB90_006668 [Kerria lacca]
MIVLFETAAGYALFKLLDEKKLQKSDNLFQDFETPERASKIIKLKHFEKFRDTTEALAATTAAVEGKLTKSLKKLLKKQLSGVQEELLVSDAKLGNAIKEKLELSVISNNAVNELMRCIRLQTESLISGLSKKDITAMELGLAHSLSRYKLKFSPDKVDTMIVQAVNLLDELDSELNNYIMRCREWYSWHFPELGTILTDNIQFIKTIKIIGTRDNVKNSDLSDILPEDLEERIKTVAEMSMGTEITELDITNIWYLCDQVIEITEYRSQLYDYLKSRMMTVAPNLTVLLGEFVGARLIAQAGSILNLAKHPASTVQILGAEKALFRALKTRKETPKYGFIYNSQLVGQASQPFKGKMSRMLAAKVSLATRVDALGDDPCLSLGVDHKAALEQKLRLMEDGSSRRISGTAKAKAKFEKYQVKSEVYQYFAAADSTLPSGKRKPLIEEINQDEPPSKKVKTEIKDEPEDNEIISNGINDDSPKKKKKKKKAKEKEKEQEQEDEEEMLPEPVAEVPELIKKKKKKRRQKISKLMKMLSMNKTSTLML